jgi:hypothetical protein
VSQPLSAVRGSTVGSSSLACKYKTRVEVTDSSKHLTYYDTARITAVKSFIVQAPVKSRLSSQSLAIRVLANEVVSL